MNEEIKKVIGLLNFFIEKGAYGSLTVKFEAGKIVYIVREESIKLSKES